MTMIRTRRSKGRRLSTETSKHIRATANNSAATEVLLCRDENSESDSGKRSRRRDSLLLGTLVSTAASTMCGHTQFSDAAPAIEVHEENRNDDNKNNKNNVVVVTGASQGGIGFAIATQLLDLGYTVIPCCRTAATAFSVQDALARTASSGIVCALDMDCDLASLTSVLNYSHALKESLSVTREENSPKRLHAIVNNAGLGWQDERFTVDGYEEQFAVNHLGHYLLTTEMIKWAQDTSSSGDDNGSERLRVINVSSSAHFAGVVNPARLVALTSHGENRPYTRFGAYCDSKLANVLFTKELARRYAFVRAAAVHPGIVNTRLIRHIVPHWVMEEKKRHPGRDAILGRSFGLRSPEDGARGAVWLASVPNSDVFNGRYYAGVEDERQPASAALSESRARSLWAASEVLVSRALNRPIADEVVAEALVSERGGAEKSFTPSPGGLMFEETGNPVLQGVRMILTNNI